MSVPFSRLPLTTLAALLLAALPAAAGAQSLEDLYQAARAFDATYLAAKASAASAEFRVAQSDALARPSLAATAGASRTEIDAPHIGRRDNNNAQVGLSGRYPLLNRANRATIEQAQKSLQVAQADLDAAEQDLIVRVAQAYFDVLTAQDTVTATRANKTAITEQLASAKRNFEVGTATITDAREAQAKFDLATASGLAAENDLTAKRIALDTLVGRTGVQPKALVTPMVLPPLSPTKAEEWVAVADAQHPGVRRARVGLEVAQLETAKARAAEGPTLDVVGSLGSSYSRGLAVAIPGTTNTASVGVQMNWPLYTGGATQNRIKETLVLEDKSRNDLEAARRMVSQGTQVAFYGVKSVYAQVQALEAAEASSKLSLESTQLGYKVGVRVNLDVLNANTQLYTTQRDLAKARYDVLMGGLRLRQASGQLAPADVARINALLAK